MKNKLLLPLAFLGLSFISGCGKDDENKTAPDPCADTTCLNGGYCANGDCNCPEGYTGSDCGQEKTPTKIRITEVQVTRFPATKPDGGGWDNDGTAPDLSLVVFKGEGTNQSILWTDPSFFQDVVPGTTKSFSTDIVITEVGTNHSLILTEYTPGEAEKHMGGYSFIPWSSGHGFPKEFTMDVASNAVAYKITATYEW